MTQSPATRSIAGRYQLVGKLAIGGMGAVYAGVDLRTDRRVALKILLRQRGTAENKQRFATEAQAIARIRHPNVVEVLDWGETESGRPFIVLEYLEGEALKRFIRRKHILLWREAAPIVLQICAAMAAAHRVNVVHRDLKPNNILLLPNEGSTVAIHGGLSQTPAPEEPSVSGAPPPMSARSRAPRERFVAPATRRVAMESDTCDERPLERLRSTHLVKVLDFGAAKLTEDDPNRVRITRTGTLIGTPSFLAPEQLLGNPVDARTDIYALGIMMYRMLSGALPFPARNLGELVTLQLKNPPKRPREVNPDAPISEAVEVIILKALAMQQHDRYASMDELAEAIAKVPAPA